jgi:hypothetical protein
MCGNLREREAEKQPLCMPNWNKRFHNVQLNLILQDKTVKAVAKGGDYPGLDIASNRVWFSPRQKKRLVLGVLLGVSFFLQISILLLFHYR